MHQLLNSTPQTILLWCCTCARVFFWRREGRGADIRALLDQVLERSAGSGTRGADGGTASESEGGEGAAGAEQGLRLPAPTRPPCGPSARGPRPRGSMRVQGGAGPPQEAPYAPGPPHLIWARTLGGMVLMAGGPGASAGASGLWCGDVVVWWVVVMWWCGGVVVWCGDVVVWYGGVCRWDRTPASVRARVILRGVRAPHRAMPRCCGPGRGFLDLSSDPEVHPRPARVGRASFGPRMRCPCTRPLCLRTRASACGRRPWTSSSEPRGDIVIWGQPRDSLGTAWGQAGDCLGRAW